MNTKRKVVRTVPYVYWDWLLHIGPYSLCRCRTCGAIYLRIGSRRHVRLWGRSCSLHS